MLTVSELWSPFSECVVSSNRRGVLGELWLGVLCAGAETVFGWVAVCPAGWQVGTQVAVQTARHAEMAAAAKPEEEAVVSGCNIPPGCPVPHTSASSFCSETLRLRRRQRINVKMNSCLNRESMSKHCLAIISRAPTIWQIQFVSDPLSPRLIESEKNYHRITAAQMLFG